MQLVVKETFVKQDSGVETFGRLARLGPRHRSSVEGWPSDVDRHRSSFVPYEKYNSGFLSGTFEQIEAEKTIKEQVRDILNEFVEEWEGSGPTLSVDDLEGM